MKKTPNRIFFLNNPYPNGHKIKKFVWSGRLDEDEKLWFDFHLKTADYDAEDETEDEDEDEDAADWEAKIVWENYNSCTLSSTHWGESKGILIDTSKGKFHFENLLKTGLSADTLPLKKNADLEELAFNIYLLGHDSCANHQLKFLKNKADTYDIEWTGKIALTYAGDDEFQYDFIANIYNVQFDGFSFPDNWSIEKAKAVFESKLADIEAFEFLANSKSKTQKSVLKPKKK